MTSDEIREKYFKFFEEKGHKRIEPAPLVLESDPTTLFTSAGMQPLIPYLKGEKHPKGKRLVDSQPSLRLQDIEEVGDNRHTTFFEMLGNWSLGDYFKKEQLSWCLEFFTKSLGLPKEKLWVSVFEGTKDVPKDTKSYEIWKSLGIPEKRIHFYGADKNWWSRSGTPDSMPEGEIGGPDSEVFYEFDIPHNPKFGKECHPNCECGKFLEIGNSVFIQYQKEKDGSLKELPQKNVDFGGGLERLTAAVNNTPDIFEIDVYKPLISEIEKGGQKYGKDEDLNVSFRIVADHVRAAVMIAAEGVTPSNKLEGYILRRLIRRAVFHLNKLGEELTLSEVCAPLRNSNPKVERNWERISKVLEEESKRFKKTLRKGLNTLKDAIEKGEKIDGKFAFDLYQTQGFPLELTLEILKQEGKKFTKEEKKKFEEEFENHKEKSRSASAGMFKGGLADTSDEVVRLHTATHLLHAALRKILGEGVEQKGSNITAERLRFDFSYPKKLTDEEIKKVQDLINEKVKEDLPVSFKEMSLDEVIKQGALHFFGERYGKKVKVYTIGNHEKGWFSKEVCGGPHVKSTKEVGRVRIIKQEKVGAGIIRLYAVSE